MARLTDHNVVATFADLDKAREVMEELGDEGIDGDDISLLGKQVEDVISDPDTRLRDMEATADLGKRAVTTGGIGAVVGGIAGAAAFVIPGVGPVVGAGIWGALAGGAIAGGVVGGMIGTIDAVELGPEWEVTYGEPLQQGRVIVAVHARDDEEAEKAEKVFREQGADRVDHLGEEGKPRQS